MEEVGINTNGLTLSEYCNVKGDSPSSVWQKIRAGELISRAIHGRLKIFDSSQVGHISPRPFGATAKNRAENAELPELPDLEDVAKSTAVSVTSGQVSVITGAEHGQEVSLLIDHLSLAKEENREILSLTQSSIRKITEMSEQLLEAKEQVIDAHKQTIHEKNLLIEMQQEKIQNAPKPQTGSRKKLQQVWERRLADQKKTYEKIIQDKDDKVDLLSAELTRLSAEMMKLRQDYEDLDTLARTLASRQRP
ncbi:keratin [Oligoflexaceae bacterium]|nr:keratin [Oligoflexaceae bacterium]